MPNTQKITIHGVEVTQTQLQGKWYTPVDGRVKIAEQADPAKVRREGAGYHVVSVQIMQVGDRWAYHCMVEYPAGSGVVKPGTDFIDLTDSAGIAKAETSAIGRALGLHGIACEESIASAEEVEQATNSRADAPTHAPQPHPAARTQHAPASTSDAPAASQARTAPSVAPAAPAVDPLALTHASAQDQANLVEALRKAGYTTQTGVQNLLLHVTGRMIPAAKLQAAESDLSITELARVHEFLTRIPAAKGNGKAATQ